MHFFNTLKFSLRLFGVKRCSLRKCSPIGDDEPLCSATRWFGCETSITCIAHVTIKLILTISLLSLSFQMWFAGSVRLAISTLLKPKKQVTKELNYVPNAATRTNTSNEHRSQITKDSLINPLHILKLSEGYFSLKSVWQELLVWWSR